MPQQLLDCQEQSVQCFSHSCMTILDHRLPLPQRLASYHWQSSFRWCSAIGWCHMGRVEHCNIHSYSKILCTCAISSIWTKRPIIRLLMLFHILFEESQSSFFKHISVYDGTRGFSKDQLKGKQLSPTFRQDALVIFRAEVKMTL